MPRRSGPDEMIGSCRVAIALPLRYPGHAPFPEAGVLPEEPARQCQLQAIGRHILGSRRRDTPGYPTSPLSYKEDSVT